MSDEQQQKSDSSPSPSNIRDEMVEKAVKFLLDRKVLRTPLEDRRQFLGKKGLTEDEINAAFKLAEQQQPLLLDPVKSYYNKHDDIPVDVPILTKSEKISSWRDRAQFFVIAGGATYITFNFIKNYIVPRWFGKKSSKNENDQIRLLHDNLSDVQNSLKFLVDSCQQTLHAVQKQQEVSQKLLQRLSERNDDRNFERAILDLKNELSIVKSLLLSRDQFPPVPISKPIALPAWQMCRINGMGDNLDEGKEFNENAINEEDGSVSSIELNQEQKITPV